MPRDCGHIGRRRPAGGVFISLRQPTIVFLTVVTKDRVPCLANDEVHRAICEVWKAADAWMVGCYILMPDHLHLFVAPVTLEFTLDAWVRYWKSLATRMLRKPNWRWQTGHWDTRLRREENYRDKWEYVRQNPVRAGLVSDANAWPWQGEMNELPW